VQVYDDDAIKTTAVYKWEKSFSDGEKVSLTKRD